MTGCAASFERCRKRNPMRARFRAAAGDHAGRSLRCPQRDGLADAPGLPLVLGGCRVNRGR
jgi:hypothetical protein